VSLLLARVRAREAQPKRPVATNSASCLRSAEQASTSAVTARRSATGRRRSAGRRRRCRCSPTCRP